MIFTNQILQNLSFTPKIRNYNIQRKDNARFLGVIVNENLTWNNHTDAIKAKMSRYVGILYKLKSLIPLAARKNIFHSFVQSHLNFCSLVWGLANKSSIEQLFTEQKKAIRALAPGFNLNYYKDGKFPCHTKSFFIENNIMTVHSIILSKVITFMHKYHNFRIHVPHFVSDIILKNAPRYSLTNDDNAKEWSSSHSSGKSRNALSFKGPLFYLRFFPEILELYKNNHNNNIFPMPLKAFKKYANSFLINIQSSGNPEEWEAQNMPLNHVTGIPRRHRANIPEVFYGVDKENF